MIPTAKITQDSIVLTYLKAPFIEVCLRQAGGAWDFLPWIWEELEDGEEGRCFLSCLGLSLFNPFSFPASDSNVRDGSLTVSCEMCASVFAVRWTSTTRGGGSELGSPDIPTSDRRVWGVNVLWQPTWETNGKHQISSSEGNMFCTEHFPGSTLKVTLTLKPFAESTAWTPETFAVKAGEVFELTGEKPKVLLILAWTPQNQTWISWWQNLFTEATV